MSQLLIQNYLNELDRIRKIAGATTEQVIRRAFSRLLEDYARANKLVFVVMADRDNGIITLDAATQLTGIPPEAFLYKLGNRSGLDWILDQYKEKTPRDPTIREKFNTYRFADYKEKVVDLIGRVTRVSVETVAITRAMGDASDLR